jgi:predicted ATPase
VDQLLERDAELDSLVATVEGLADGRGAVIEDAHWADPASLDLVRILARRAEDAPLALIVTLRDDELAANPALAGPWSATSPATPP